MDVPMSIKVPPSNGDAGLCIFALYVFSCQPKPFLEASYVLSDKFAFGILLSWSCGFTVIRPVSVIPPCSLNPTGVGPLLLHALSVGHSFVV